jgi:hypothetical protein
MFFRIAFFVSILSIPFVAEAEPMVVIHGVPSVKISEGGIDRAVENIQPSKAVSLACVIQEIDGKYYWASRGNKPLVQVTSGAFITYLAVDGAGFIRTIDPSSRTAAALLSDTESTFEYVEHLNLGLRSVTYYGKMNP